MAIYPLKLFASRVRSTAASFILDTARLVAYRFPNVGRGELIPFFGVIPRTAVTRGLICMLGLVVPWFLPGTNGKPVQADWPRAAPAPYRPDSKVPRFGAWP